MTNAQHTPGPWIITRFHHSPASIEARDTYGGALAKVYLTDPNTHRRTPEYLANARLIASAPELLASLERLVTLMNIVGDEPFSNGVTDSTGSMDQGIVIASKWLHEARAAIAKATGQ